MTDKGLGSGKEAKMAQRRSRFGDPRGLRYRPLILDQNTWTSRMMCSVSWTVSPPRSYKGLGWLWYLSSYVSKGPVSHKTTLQGDTITGIAFILGISREATYSVVPSKNEIVRDLTKSKPARCFHFEYLIILSFTFFPSSLHFSTSSMSISN
jgi:hypothetical protein